MTNSKDQRVKNRRSFLQGSLVTGSALAGAAVLGGNKLAGQSAEPERRNEPGRHTRGDVAVLRLVAAVELIETDLWQQYAELGGVTADNPYATAFENLDDDGPQYITSNTTDEESHAAFLNAYLASKGEEPVNLDRFRTLPSSQAEGAKQIGRLTNLTKLKVDTSWYTRYRSPKNPDFGATFPQALPALFAKPFTAIPRTNADFTPADHVQAIANTAAFHFASIEQGGSSLYPTLAQQVTSVEVLRILFSIGADEVAHFLEWVDFAGNSVQPPIAPLTDPLTGLTFPNFDAHPNPLLQTSLIFPVPCEFISPNLPHCAVIRPTLPDGTGGARATADYFINSGLFIGQPQEFLEVLLTLAIEADLARREHR